MVDERMGRTRMDVWTGRPWPALSPKAFVGANLAGLCSGGRTDGWTDGRSGREGANETTRWKSKNDNSRNNFVSLLSLSSKKFKPETQIPRRRSFGWTNERTDDQDGRELTKRRAGKTETTIPETNLFLCFL